MNSKGTINAVAMDLTNVKSPEVATRETNAAGKKGIQVDAIGLTDRDDLIAGMIVTIQSIKRVPKANRQVTSTAANVEDSLIVLVLQATSATLIKTSITRHMADSVARTRLNDV